MYWRSMERRLVLRRYLARGLSGLGLVAGTLGVTGCGTIEPVAPYEKQATDPTQLYMSLTLDYTAVTLSTAPSFSTQQLVATPRDALGNAMTGLPAPTFESPDTTKVKITDNGLLTAVGSTGPTPLPVVATLTAGSVTRHDTAWVKVTTLANPPVPASLSLDPVLPDSAFVALDYPSFGSEPDLSEFVFAFAGYYGDYRVQTNHKLVARAVDANGAAIDGLQIAYASLDPAIATVNSFVSDNLYALVPLRPGQVRVVARTASYGVTQTATATFTVTWPAQLMVEAQPRPAGSFRPSEVKIRPYGMIFWANGTADAADVTFDDPSVAVLPPPDLCSVMDFMTAIFTTLISAGSSCGAGNVLLTPPTVAGTTYIQVRQFVAPGVYPYHNSSTGATGRVIVTDDPSD